MDRKNILTKANQLKRKGKLDQAIAQYEKALSLNPNLALCHYRLGEVLAEQGELDTAVKYLEKAIELKPDVDKFNFKCDSLFHSRLEALTQELAQQKISRTNQAQKTLEKNNSAMHLLHQKFWDVLAQKKEPILVLGMHNSGTSLLAEILHKNGLFMGVDMAHYESSFFSIFINNNLIMGGGSNWAQIPIMSVEKVKTFKNKVESYIKNLWVLDYLRCGYNGESAWGFKDPRLCVLLPLYIEIFPNSKVVHIRRNPNDVAASLCRKKKLGVGQIDNFDYWKTLTLQHVERVLEYANCCQGYYELNYEDLCLDSEKTVLQLFDFLNLRFTDETKNLLKKVHSSRVGSFQLKE